MKITRKDVLHTASLAHLQLKKDELRQTAEDLKNILAYFNKLQSLDTKDVPPFTHSGKTISSLRNDMVVKSLPRDKILKNAPSIKGPYIKVPKIIEG